MHMDIFEMLYRCCHDVFNRTPEFPGESLRGAEAPKDSMPMIRPVDPYTPSSSGSVMSQISKRPVRILDSF
jgi:hypothetical protein